ncbi:unnamed protein product [Plutella xylostella]|uniref:(diamondback moth) hypothetical protein n=1 Tax=Plutella xylostella TaxID=51655 RepID=A0A8S4GA03_PLUXY|nr:unnamed protein product [Plutella xylostella]
MPPDYMSDERRVLRRRLGVSLRCATEVLQHIESMMKHMMGHNHKRLCWTVLSNFSLPQSRQLSHGEGTPSGTIAAAAGQWLQTHEEAQVMLGSVLVMVGVWWLARTLISLVFNLLCPLLLVLGAVVCFPQLRQPLLGQHYPAAARCARALLLAAADRIKTD